ncbi:hypothetical protein L1887_60168 [Cichorium endivia]|nr:hypothetical protein L1887_60168 [Cichorium endivia]
MWARSLRRISYSAVRTIADSPTGNVAKARLFWSTSAVPFSVVVQRQMVSSMPMRCTMLSAVPRRSMFWPWDSSCGDRCTTVTRAPKRTRHHVRVGPAMPAPLTSTRHAALGHDVCCHHLLDSQIATRSDIPSKSAIKASVKTVCNESYQAARARPGPQLRCSCAGSLRGHGCTPTVKVASAEAPRRESVSAEHT